MTPHEALQREISNQVAQYLEAGNQIESLPGPEFRPPPKRHHPQARKKKPPVPPSTRPEVIARYEEYGPRILKLFEEKVSINGIAKRVQKGTPFIRACLWHYGIDPASRISKTGPMGNYTESSVLKLKEMSERGTQVKVMARELGLTYGQTVYLMRRHGFVVAKGK